MHKDTITRPIASQSSSPGKLITSAVNDICRRVVVSVHKCFHVSAEASLTASMVLQFISTTSRQPPHTKFTDGTSFDFVPYNVSYIVSMISGMELGAMHFLALAASYLGEIVVRL
jgi:hypothetical protein